VARDLGAEVIIAVNLGSGHLPRDRLGNILGVFEQMIAILTEQNVQASLSQIDPRRDLLIVPELGDIGSGDFTRAAEAIAIGEAAARRAAPQLARFSVSEAEYRAWQREHRGAGQASERIGEVKVVGLQGAYVNPKVFDGLVDAHQVQPLDRERLVEDIQRIYGDGDFERISYHFKPTLDGHDGLIVDAVEKAWGPGYLSFGLGLSNDFRGDNRFGLRATYDRRWVNRLGAEWNTELTIGNAPSLYTELYQPLSLDRTAFVAPYLGMNLNPESVFFKDQRVARYDVTRSRLGADLGTTLRGVELRAGPFVGQTGIALDTGDPELPEGDFRDSGLRGRILYDTLDSGGSPRFGTRVALNLLNPLEALGADLQYSRLSLDLDTARSWGPNTLALRLRAGSTFGKELPYYDQFSLGGFLNLSGYANDQLRGNDKLFGSLAYARKIASLTPPIGRGIYLGASLEAGWLSDGIITDPVTGTKVLLSPEETHVGGSLFLGSDTWIGPAYLAVGLSGTGENTIYMLIGRP
jgi:NTE family protein